MPKILFQKGHKVNLGRHYSEETKQKMRKPKPTLRNENHHNWKGDDVKKGALHYWIRRYLPEPHLCEFCGKIQPDDLACITGKYTRNFENWKYLCQSCHQKYDIKVGMRPKPTRLL